MTDIFTINGHPIPVPDADVAVKRIDIEGESVRDRSGMLHRTVLRQVRSWEFRYSRLTDENRQYLLNLLTTGMFQFTHPQGESTCYCKEISSNFHDAAAGIWHDLRFRVEEV